MKNGFYFGRKKQWGAELVEFALTVPILVILIFGGIEVGWALFIENALVDAARLGARIAVTSSSSSQASIQTAVTNLLKAQNIPTANLQVSVSPNPFNNTSSVTTGAAIQVTVSLPYSSVGILPKALFLGGIAPLNATTVMLREY